MDVVTGLIDFIVSLFGSKPIPESTDPLVNHDPARFLAMQKHQAKAEVQYVDHRRGALLISNGGTLAWSSDVNGKLPREQWPNEWGPLTPANALEDFIVHELTFNEAVASDARAAEARLQQLGYRDAGQFFFTRATMLKHHGTPYGPNVDDANFQSQAYMQASMRAAQRKQQAQVARTAAQNPGMLQAIEGVSIEKYAELAACLAQGLGQPQAMQLLAQHGLDLARWERVNAGWMERMKRDTTATIATIYGKAFHQAGQGQYGAAGTAAAAAGVGNGAQGREPIPFEKLCEIQGAMTAWSQTGQDVTSLLKSRFNMVALDWSNVSTWWMTKMTADLAMMGEYNKRSHEYAQRYMAQRAN